jgi:hypothetical protein
MQIFLPLSFIGVSFLVFESGLKSLAIIHIQFLFSKITADAFQRFVPRESKYSRFILPLGLIKPEDHLSRTDEPYR